MSNTLSLPEARRLAVASQGFGTRPAKPAIGHVRALAARLHALQIDSVNVLARAHYVPAFARLGPYPMAALDSLAYRKRELFEYWGHAACLWPVSLYPIMRYRMHADETREYMRSDRGAYTAKVYAEVEERGPIAAGELSNPGKGTGNWWGWGSGKATLEHLYDSGLIAIAGRRGFERLYDLAERVVPRAAIDAPALSREESMKQLICLGAKSYGVGTLGDIVGYFKTDGWRDRLPRRPWWERPKGRAGQRAKPLAKRLVHKRVYGYYVFPFLLGDTLVARCDLKADRQLKVLMVRNAHLETGHDARHVATALAEELRLVQAWLELDRIEVANRRDVAATLRQATRPARSRH